MFNNPLFNEEAKLKIRQRDREAETYQMHKQLGYSDRRAVRWVFFILVMLLPELVILLLR